MEQAPRKRGRPKLFLTKEMIEERKLLKRICRNTRRNLQGDASLGDAATGTLDENGGNAAPDANSTGEAPPGEAAAASLDENEGNAASDENLASSTGQQANSIGSRRLRQNIDMKKKRFFENNLILDLGNQDKTCACCGAMVWAAEFTGRHVGNGPKGYSICCVKGKVQLPLLQETPPELLGLLTSNERFHSGAVAGAREALSSGVPSMSISLNWKRDDSQESDLKDAVSVCLPLITAAISDIQKGDFPKCCLLNVDIPTSPLKNKLVDKDLEDANEELDFRALENGYVAITPIFLSPSTDADIQAAVSSWIASAIQEPQ